MIYGYARVSTKGQERDGNGLEVQRKELIAAGAEMIFSDSFTGTATNRPKLDELLNTVKPGDTVVVAKLDRVARSVNSGLQIIDEFAKKGCTLRILNLGTFDNTSMGNLVRNIMLAIAEFERDTIVQRLEDGKAVARQREDYHEGRPQKEIIDFEKWREKQKRGLISVDEICKVTGISRSTWYKRCRECPT